MLVIKLLVVFVVFLIVLLLAIRMTKRGISKRYEPKSQTPWNALSEGKDPTL